MFRYLQALARNLLGKKRLDSELDEEVRAYVDLVAAEKARGGMDPPAARRAALVEIGGVEAVKEGVRDVRIGGLLESAAQDLRYACRTLARDRAFSLAVILTLALGIGANTAIFAIVNAVLLKPLPYPDANRLVMLWEKQLSDGSPDGVAPANFYDWREQSKSFQKMAAIDPYPDFIWTGSGPARRLDGAAVSGDFFSLLGTRMLLGRDFLAGEDRPDENHVVILSYFTWTSYFGRRADIVGRTLTLNNEPYTVVGVLPKDFSLVSRASDFQSRNQYDLWTPLALPSPPPAWQRTTHPLCVFGKLKAGVTLTQAQADLNRIAVGLARLYPKDDNGRGILADPLSEHVVEGVRAAMLILLNAVALVLCIACANIANLWLSRAEARRKEIAVRVALGAGRSRIARQLLAETLTLAALGGALGLSAVIFGVPALAAHLPSDLPRKAEIAVDGRVVLFTSLISLATGLAFGLAPLLQTTRIGARDALQHSSRNVAAGRSHLRSALIVGQVAIAMVLLSAAGLLTKSFWTLLRVPPGFGTDHILTARLSLPPQYTNHDAFGTGKHRDITAFQRKLLERVARIPGVQSAAFAAYLPLSGTNNSWAFTIEGRPAKPPGVYDVARYRPVSAGYFETLGIPVQKGRSFQPGDDEDGPLVVAVNAAMARRFWPNEDPVGQRLQFGGPAWRTVVGIVGDVHHVGLAAPPSPELYVPYSQVPNVEARPVIVARTAVDPAAIAGALRTAVAEVDVNVPLDHVATMRQMVSGSVAQSRFRTVLLVLFGALALFVATIGLS